MFSPIYAIRYSMLPVIDILLKFFASPIVLLTIVKKYFKLIKDLALILIPPAITGSSFIGREYYPGLLLNSREIFNSLIHNKLKIDFAWSKK